MLQQNVKRSCAVMLPVLVILLTGCATNLPNSGADCPSLPPMPAVFEPMPSRTFSASARGNIEVWRKRLTESEATGKP